MIVSDTNGVLLTLSHLPWVVAMITCYAIYFIFFGNLRDFSPKIPFFDDRQPGEITYLNSRKRFLFTGGDFLRSCQAKAKNFQIMTERGLRLILSWEYADEIRNDSRLSHRKSLEVDWCTYLPGFEPFSTRLHERPIHGIVFNLTKSLQRLTHIILDEVEVAFSKNWTDDPDWHEIPLTSSMSRIISQVSSRVFIGKEGCRDLVWLHTSIKYSEKAFGAVQSIQVWPVSLQRYVHWFLPSCQEMRGIEAKIRKILMPLISSRRQTRAALEKDGNIEDSDFILLDVIEKFNQEEGYDPITILLGLSFAAIHTTNDLVGKTILDLCEHPELIQALRNEINSVLQEDGQLEKKSLYKLKLMDSVMKETQRCSPISLVSMNRVALEDITLKDGTKIQKGTCLAVSLKHMWEPGVFSDAETYDGYRFLKMQDDPATRKGAHLVATSPEHMGFGHGKYACPGRFFATNEAKLILGHTIMNYDFELVKQDIQNVLTLGLFFHVNPEVKLRIRRRKEDVP